eukprot:2765531-Amphidinium_carterae.1
MYKRAPSLIKQENHKKEQVKACFVKNSGPHFIYDSPQLRDDRHLQVANYVAVLITRVIPAQMLPE